MYCMTAPWGPVAPNASPRRAIRLVDLFLLIVAQRLWVADHAGSLATRPPDAISAGRAAGRGAGECALRCTVNIRLYKTLAHIVAPAPAMHSCGAPCWDVVHRPCRDPDRASNQARSRGSLSQTGWVSTVDRVGNASITDLIARETATSCALLTGSNAKTRQTRSGSLRLSQGRGPLTPPPPSPRPDLPPPLPRYVSA